MRKISAVIILLAGAVMTSCPSGLANTDVDVQEMANDSTQVLNDEGYGNSDEEYYNSENGVVNVEDPSLS